MNENHLAAGALAVLAVAAAALCGAWASWWLAAEFSGAPPAPDSPAALVRDLRGDGIQWPGQATWWAVALGVLLLTLMMGVAILIGRRRGRPGSVDRAARNLPTDSGLRRYTHGATGPLIGSVIAGRAGRNPVVRMTSEDQALVIAGPRTGKTSSLAIPSAVAHDGPLLATSNKRDIYDHLAGPRSERGTVWLFDPQRLAGIPSSEHLWWDPLRMAGTVTGARRLAKLWSNAGRERGARVDAYFDPEGDELLASLLLAAAAGQRRVADVYSWLARPDDPTPIQLLEAAPGCEQMAQGLSARVGLPDRQRAGVWGTAAKTVSWMADPEIRAWVEPGPGRTEFVAGQLTDASDSLISLSREGEGSAAPLVASLTAAVLNAAEERAASEPGGRLARPLLGVLDEAANVCRWRDLPDLYSHYGSRGIVLMSYAQSWAQLVEAYGDQGAEKLWSSANVRVYAGGVSDPAFLRRLSDLAGEWDEDIASTSKSIGGNGSQRSRSVQQRRRAILDVATLGAMPAGRALVLLSAARPVLVKLVPWWDGPHARTIRAGLAASPVSTGGDQVPAATVQP